MRMRTGGRLDFWSLENSIAGRGRRYRRIVIDVRVAVFAPVESGIAGHLLIKADIGRWLRSPLWVSTGYSPKPAGAKGGLRVYNITAHCSVTL
jgi:hypothetical protein